VLLLSPDLRSTLCGLFEGFVGGRGQLEAVADSQEVAGELEDGQRHSVFGPATGRYRRGLCCQHKAGWTCHCLLQLCQGQYTVWRCGPKKVSGKPLPNDKKSY